jgi:riboflavin synthase
MFTGLISEIGKVERLTRTGVFGRLIIHAPQTAARVKPGDSVATAGACLTVETVTGERFTATVIAETLRATRLGKMRAGDRVNLELPVGPQDVFGGHLVSGHVDIVGRVKRIQRVVDGGNITINYPQAFDRWAVDKGSIAIEGVSLTIAELGRGELTVGIIPTTWTATTIGGLRPGDAVNLEFDQAIKAAVDARMPGVVVSSLSEDSLRRAGW